MPDADGAEKPHDEDRIAGAAGKDCHGRSLFVIPAKAGIPLLEGKEIPAFAGMTR